MDRYPPTVVPLEEVAQRFWSKVDTEGECWLWRAATRLTDGSGVFGFEKKILYAHRVSYLLTRGPIPDAMDIKRRCGEMLCVRPSHLYACLREAPKVHKRGNTARLNDESLNALI